MPDSRHMYIRTAYAWYILHTPSTSYFRLYARYWLKHRLVHLIVSACLDDPEITYEAFVNCLKKEDSARSMLGRSLREGDLTENGTVRNLDVLRTHDLTLCPARVHSGNAR